MIRKNFLYYFFSVTLIVLYLVILGQGLYPTVSEEYCMYYLEKNLMVWPGNGGLKYNLGTILEYGSEVESPARNLGTGWSDREEFGIWTISNEAILYFDFSEELLSIKADTLNMRIELAQWFTDQAEVEVNGQLIGVLMPQENIFVYELQFPRDLLEDGVSVITFRVKHSTHENGVGIKLRQMQIVDNS